MRRRERPSSASRKRREASRGFFQVRTSSRKKVLFSLFCGMFVTTAGTSGRETLLSKASPHKTAREVTTRLYTLTHSSSRSGNISDSKLAESAIPGGGWSPRPAPCICCRMEPQSSVLGSLPLNSFLCISSTAGRAREQDGTQNKRFTHERMRAERTLSACKRAQKRARMGHAGWACLSCALGSLVRGKGVCPGPRRRCGDLAALRGGWAAGRPGGAAHSASGSCDSPPSRA